MPKKTSKRGTKSQKNKRKAVAPDHSAKASPAQLPSDPRFVRDLLTRGEAAELTKDGKLPLSATHVIRNKNPDGSVQVKRARFKLF